MSDVPDLRQFDAVLIDLDGTFYREQPGGPVVLPGAVELVRRLEARGQKYACLTNSGASPRQLMHRLTQMGAPVDERKIWSCAAAAADYVLRRFPQQPRIFNLATEGTAELLEGRVVWVERHDEPCDAVMVAAPVNRFASVERQWVALQLLRRGARLVGHCADRVYPSHRGVEFGAGALTEMLAYAANTRPVYCGKPEPVFFLELCQRLGVAPDRCILLGDNLESDVAGAHGVGMTSCLLLTGVATRSDALALSPDRRPHYMVDDLTRFIS
ncbi:MAG: HAD-IIA family hydrolase [Tepidisphaerales bacterium]